MEQNNNQGENQVLTIKINQEDLKQIRKQEAEAQRQIRQVRKDLRKDIDRLQLRLQLANVGVIPLLIIISGIVFFFIKRRKTAAV
jgi:cell division protein FtsX